MTRDCVMTWTFGTLRLVAGEGGLKRVEFAAADTMPRSPRGRTPPARALREAARQLAEYFAGRRRRFDLPLAPDGTPFQQEVWRAVSDVDWGQTTSYREIARRVGRPRAARAVGAANGANPLPIIVPCHRVIGSDGSLAGYAGGLAAKAWLLALEGGDGTASSGPGPDPGPAAG
jgi:methylated-DNA-[protein]-cysteine S-methyltransferase